jgi:hypothetical protein
MLPFRKAKGLKRSSSWEGDLAGLGSGSDDFSEYEAVDRTGTLAHSMSDGNLAARSSAWAGYQENSNNSDRHHPWAWRLDGADDFDGSMPHLEPIESGGLTLDQLKSHMKRDARKQVCVCLCGHPYFQQYHP